VAGTVTNERPFLFSFDGSATTAGRFTQPEFIAVDDSTGSVYVLNTAGSGQGLGSEQEPTKRVIDKFNAEGEAQNFSAIGKSSLNGSATPGGAFGVQGFFGTGSLTTDVAVDNSGGSGGPGEGEQGRLYVSEATGPVHAFGPGGNYLWTLPRATVEPCGIAVDNEGHLWAVASGKALEFANTGSPPAQIGSVTLSSTTSPCRPAISKAGALYVAGTKLDKYVGGIFSSSLFNQRFTDIAVDQTQLIGHLFGSQSNNFREFDSSDTQIGSFGGDLLGDSRGIAYNAAKDWVYVSDVASGTVKVFGPKASGTVPDVTIESATEIGVSKATAHGKINPQSVPDSYHFEWKQGEGTNWGSAKSQPPPYPSIEPTDSAEHAVSVNVTGLKGNTTYQMRLVGTNTENGLNVYSSPTTFTTTQPSAPAVSINTPFPVTTTTADATGTVNPQGDFGTTWRLRLSTDPTCSTGFSDLPIHNLGSEASTPVAVSEELTGLLPAQTYCVRISATNAGGTATAEKVFSTTPIPPDEVSTAFAAPRTDTTARINGYVNPEGEADFTYRFELSTDGVNWTVLPDRESTVDARQQIVVGDDLTSLIPNTTYHYRLVSAENAEGSTPATGGERTFTTRRTAEMTLPEPRGYELVNNPDKGNQNVEAWPVSLDTPQQTSNGDRVLWSVAGGAPGGNSGTGSLFLAERSPGGWRSRTVQPPADQQVGEGGFAYALGNATPSFNKFIFITGRSSPVGTVVANTLVRLDDAQNQEVLTHDSTQAGSEVEITDDGSHVVQMSGFVSKETRQLVDVGGGAPQVLSLMPDGTESSCGLAPKSFGGGDNVGAGAQWRPGYHMIATTNASRAYFQVPPNGECGGLFGIYERNREAGKTTLIDPGASGHDPEFIRATPDGRHAYFATYSKCRKYEQVSPFTCESLESADTNSDPDVYRWDEEAGESTCLTCVVPDANLDTNGGVLNYVMVSDDFSHVYFESRNQLVPGEGTPGDANLYVLSGGTLRFVANPNANRGVLRYGIASAKLSPDGSVLIFQAPASRVLTADGVARECPKVASVNFGESNACEELYRYDGRDGSLECLSCEQGAVTANSVGTQIASDGAFKMSADGSTVAFATAQALLPRDINLGTDIYEWRNGARRLLTDGVSRFPSGFAAPQVRGVDADGSNILFSVVEPGLTGFEQDGVANLYDARIGGGFVPPQPAAHCTEESCQGPLQVAPGAAQPGSATLSGPGNAKAGFKKKGRCTHKRGKAKRRCIRRHKKHSGKAGGRSR